MRWNGFERYEFHKSQQIFHIRRKYFSELSKLSLIFPSSPHQKARLPPPPRNEKFSGQTDRKSAQTQLPKWNRSSSRSPWHWRYQATSDSELFEVEVRCKEKGESENKVKWRKSEKIERSKKSVKKAHNSKCFVQKNCKKFFEFAISIPFFLFFRSNLN